MSSHFNITKGIKEVVLRGGKVASPDPKGTRKTWEFVLTQAEQLKNAQERRILAE